MIRFLHPAGLNVKKRVGEEREGLYNFLVVVYIYIYLSTFILFLLQIGASINLCFATWMKCLKYIYIYISEEVVTKKFYSK